MSNTMDKLVDSFLDYLDDKGNSYNYKLTLAVVIGFWVAAFLLGGGPWWLVALLHSGCTFVFTMATSGNVMPDGKENYIFSAFFSTVFGVVIVLLAMIITTMIWISS